MRKDTGTAAKPPAYPLAEPGQRWTLEVASIEFEINPRTLKKRLVAAEMWSPGGQWTTKQIRAAIDEDITTTRKRLYAAQAEQKELENARTRGELVETKGLAEVLCQAVESVAAAIKAQTNVETEDKNKQLAAIESALERFEEMYRGGKATVRKDSD